MTNSNATLVREVGVMKKILPTQMRPGKNGRDFPVYAFVLSRDGQNDLFVNSFKPFDKNLLHETVEAAGTMFGDKTLNLKESLVRVESEEDYDSDVVEQSDEGESNKVNESTKPKRRGRPKKEATVKVRETNKNTTSSNTGGVDWAAKDRAMAAGGLMHDAAALVAPLVNDNSEVELILEMVEEIAVGLVKVKHKVEEELKQ